MACLRRLIIGSGSNDIMRDNPELVVDVDGSITNILIPPVMRKARRHNSISLRKGSQENCWVPLTGRQAEQLCSKTTKYIQVFREWVLIDGNNLIDWKVFFHSYAGKKQPSSLISFIHYTISEGCAVQALMSRGSTSSDCTVLEVPNFELSSIQEYLKGFQVRVL